MLPGRISTESASRRGESRGDDLPSNFFDQKEGEEPPPKKQKPAAPVEKPSFEVSGGLAEEGNRYKGRLLKWNEPPDLRPPSEKWRLYIFKDGVPMEGKEPYMLRATAYMFGRDRGVVDIPTDHPTCSQQHAVLCHRLVHMKKVDENGLVSTTRANRPYLLDLDSVNGTFLNGKRIESSRYVELKSKDIIKFGTSSREYVLMNELEAPDE
eukprot:RCo037512